MSALTIILGIHVPLPTPIRLKALRADATDYWGRALAVGIFYSVYNHYLWNDGVCHGSQSELMRQAASRGLAYKPILLL